MQTSKVRRRRAPFAGLPITECRAIAANELTSRLLRMSKFFTLITQPGTQKMKFFIVVY